MLGGHVPEGDTCEEGHMRGRGHRGGQGEIQDMQPICSPLHAPVCPPCLHEEGSAVGWGQWGDTP